MLSVGIIWTCRRLGDVGSPASLLIARRDSGYSRRLKPCLNLGSDPSKLQFQAGTLTSGAAENSTA